jgi:hypothetical protein
MAVESTGNYYDSFDYFNNSHTPLPVKLSTGPHTIGFWLKPNASPSSSSIGGMFNVRDQSILFYVAFVWDHSTASFQSSATIRNSSGTFFSAQDPSPSSDNLWHYYVCLWDGANIKLYKDGTQVASVAVSGTLDTSLAEYVSALSSYNSTQIKQGFPMAELAVWNTALSGANITSLAGGADPRTIAGTNLYAFWPLYGRQYYSFDYSGWNVSGQVDGAAFNLVTVDAANSYASGRPTFGQGPIAASPPIILNRQQVVGTGTPVLVRTGLSGIFGPPPTPPPSGSPGINIRF